MLKITLRTEKRKVLGDLDLYFFPIPTLFIPHPTRIWCRAPSCKAATSLMSSLNRAECLSILHTLLLTGEHRPKARPHLAPTPLFPRHLLPYLRASLVSA